MLDFKKKRKIKEILYSRVTVILLFVVFVFSVSNAWDVYKKASFASDNKKIAEDDLNALKERESSLVRKIDRLKTDRGTEEEIREKFGLVKKGEEVVVIVDSKEEKSKDNKNRLGVAGEWWRKFLELFK